MRRSAPLLSCSYLLFGELAQRHLEELGVYRGQDQPVRFSALGSHKAVEIGPLVAPLSNRATGPLPTGAHTRLIITGFRPSRASSSAQRELDPCPRISLPDLLSAAGEGFFESFSLVRVGSLGA